MGRAGDWIGDRRAFESYQRGYHDTPVAAPISIPGVSAERAQPVSDAEIAETIRMANGIFRLASDDWLADVGEALISAFSSREGFRYDEQAFLSADHEQIVTGDECVSADWGTVAEGGFGYSTLVPVVPGIGVLGLYFPHRGLGLLYTTLSRRDDAFVYTGVTQGQFRACVADEHGVEIDGPSLRAVGALRV